MNELLYDDLHLLIRRLPKPLREALKQAKKDRLFLAGGCIRSLIAGEPISDYDIFGQTLDGLESAAKDLALEYKGRVHKTQNAFTVLAPPRTPVQFITRWLYPQPELVAQSFDFSICQAVVWWDRTEGKWRSLTSEMFYPDLAARRLRYLSPERNEDAGGSLLRMVKFLRKGYNIAPESLGKVIARLCSRVDWDRDSGVLASGEEGVAKILTGLLREVDPLVIIDGLEMPEAEGEEQDSGEEIRV